MGRGCGSAHSRGAHRIPKLSCTPVCAGVLIQVQDVRRTCPGVDVTSAASQNRSLQKPELERILQNAREAITLIVDNPEALQIDVAVVDLTHITLWV